MDRLDDLKALREGLIARMADCSSDQNYAVMGRLLVDTIKQIAELDPTQQATIPGGGVLVDFQARLADRTGAGA